MSKFTEYIGSQFGNPRGVIGKVCCILMNIINKEMYKRTVSLISISSNANSLDIGYGNGYFLKQLYKTHRPNMYGIDISEDSQKQASKRNSLADSKGKLHLTVGDCCDLPYDNNYFDVVTSINTIYFWNDTVKGLSEINRVLKPGGSFFNVVYTKEWLQKLSYTKKGFKFFEKNDFLSMGKQAGFSDITIQEIVKNKSFVVIFSSSEDKL